MLIPGEDSYRLQSVPVNTTMLASLKRCAILKKLYTLCNRYVKPNGINAGLLNACHKKHVIEFWPVVAQREGYKNQWSGHWQEEYLDFGTVGTSCYTAWCNEECLCSLQLFLFV